ncbi:MAG: LysR family transcriptional regulator [archaeon]
MYVDIKIIMAGITDKKDFDSALLAEMKPGYKFWLRIGPKPIMGGGRYKVLKTISRTHSIKEAAKLLNISYRACQNYIKTMEERLEKEVVHTERGGLNGGGSAELTPFGKALVRKFESIKFKVVCDDKR